MPPSAIVSVPVPRSPMLNPATSLQREPAPATLTVPSEPAPLPMLVTRGVISMTLPPFVIYECACAKTADIEPVAWSVDPTRCRAGHRHRTRRAGRQTDGAAATSHRAAVLDGQRACALAANHGGGVNLPSWSRGRSPSPYPSRPVNCQQSRGQKWSMSRRPRWRAFLSRFDRWRDFGPLRPRP